MAFQLNHLGVFHAMVALIIGQTPSDGPNRDFKSASRFILPCLLAFVCYFLPSAAWAEGRCPPGMFETGSRDFIACAPIPGYNQGGNDGGDDSVESRVPTLKVYLIQDSYMAAVTHMDASLYWVSRGHWTADSANKRALASCQALMGDGCAVAETVYGDHPFGVMIDAMGLPWIKASTAPKGSPLSVRFQAAAMLCQKNSFGCMFETYINQGGVPFEAAPPQNFVTDEFSDYMVNPRTGVKRHHWALIARPEGTPRPAWQNKVWLMSGSQNSAEARKSVLDRCRADSEVSCVIDTYVANGVLVHFVDTKGQSRWTNAVTKRAVDPLSDRKKQPKIDPTSVAARVDRLCPVSAKPCKVIATYDAATRRMQVIED